MRAGCPGQSDRRALGTHTWYQKKFPEYPTDRKALIPRVL